MMRGIILGWFVLISSHCLGQYFQFSQYNFTPQRINPAQVGSTDYASLSFDYRNQATDGGFHLTSNLVNIEYPLLSRDGVRWSGIGVSLMDDRSGQAGIFNTQEIGLSFAAHVRLSSLQQISLGVQTIYQNRKMNLDGLYTGAQYIPDRGFDESISSGENFGLLRTDFMTFSTGLYWQRVEKNGNRIAYLGLSFYDFNKPDNAFLESSSHLNSTWVGSLGFRIYHEGNMSIFPELLFTRSGATNVVNVGAIFRADLKTTPLQPAAHVDLITRYVTGRSGVLGLQYHNEVFSAGFSYDFPVVTRNVANTGAFEVGLAFRKLVSRARKTQQQKSNDAGASTRPPGKKLGAPVGVKVPAQTQPTNSTDSAQTAQGNGGEDLSTRLRQKQDSVIAQANAGNLKHEPLILEKATLYFNFEFNSTTLDEEARTYLDDLAKALADNPELNLRLVGHTDNVGSGKFNLRLSQQRAEALAEYLIDHGVLPQRIQVEGHGMREPLNNNENEEERSQNRRVELTITYDK